MRKITLPMDEKTLQELTAGEWVLISGEVYTARDAAHQRMVQALENGESLPIELANQSIYYSGPCPGFGPYALGSCGPTTSGRMDGYTPVLLDRGLKVMIGKGARSKEVAESIQRCGAVYLAAIGGAGALMAQRVQSAEIVAYPELGPEAIRRLNIEEFPCIVAIDAHGGNLYER